MTGATVDEDTKRDTIAMLQRVQQQQEAESLPTGGEDNEAAQSDGEGVDEELACLLSLAGDETLDLSSLSPDQQRQFLRAIHDGTLSRHITIAVPWWVPSGGRQQNETGQGQEHEARQWQPATERRLVEDVEQEQSEEGQLMRAFVQLLPPLSSVLPTEPSPCATVPRAGDRLWVLLPVSTVQLRA